MNTNTNTPSAADLSAAIERADAQLADLERQVTEAKDDHRASSHGALIAGKDAPPPPANLAALADRIAALQAARAELSDQHKQRALHEAQCAGNAAADKAAELRSEFERRFAMAVAIIQAAHEAFATLTDAAPDVNVICRDLKYYPGKNGRAALIKELGELRRKLPECVKGYVSTDVEHYPPQPFVPAFRSIAANHIAELIGN